MPSLIVMKKIMLIMSNQQSHYALVIQEQIKSDGHTIVQLSIMSAGHYFHKVQLNLRNYANPDELKKAQLGNHLYTEAGSLGEGLADYYSYYVNGRSHWGSECKVV